MSIPFDPMLAVPSTSQGGRSPVDIRSLSPQQWTFEEKVDGVRVVMVWDGTTVRLWGRSGLEVTASFPEVVASVAAGAGRHAFVLDGELELVRQDHQDATLADLLARVQTRRRATVTRLARSAPAWLQAFDLLQYGDVPQIARPHRERVAILADVVAQTGADALQVVRSSSDGVGLLAQTRADQREGVIAKRRDSIYTPGRRSHTWIKFKNTHRLTCVGYSYVPGNGSRAAFGALELAVLREGQAVAVGSVGSGLSEHEIRLLRAAIDAGRFPLVEIECLGISTGGSLRQPVYLHLRTDVGYDAASADQLDSLPVST